MTLQAPKLKALCKVAYDHTLSVHSIAVLCPIVTVAKHVERFPGPCSVNQVTPGSDKPEVKTSFVASSASDRHINPINGAFDVTEGGSSRATLANKSLTMNLGYPSKDLGSMTMSAQAELETDS